MAATWENVTITTVDGWEYPNMIVIGADGGDTVVMIGAGGGRRKMPRSRIRLILDADGRDISQAVFAAPGEGTADPAASEPELDTEGAPEALQPPPYVEAPETATTQPNRRPLQNIWPRQRFKYSPALALGYGSTSGDWFEGMTSGLAIDGKLRIVISEAVFLGFGYRKQNVGVEPELEILLGVPVDWDVSLSEYFMSVGIMSSPKKLTSPIGYAEFGLGFVKTNIEITVADDPLIDPSISGLSSSTDETELGLSFEGGVLIPVKNNIALDLGLSWRMTSNGEADTQEVFGYILGYRAGIAFLLGSE